MFKFQNCKYLEIPIVMKFCFSTTFVASLPQLGRNGTSLKTPLGSFGWPSSSNFHSQMVGPCFELHIFSFGDTLYCITCHLEESTKKWKRCISICHTSLFAPSFKYPSTQVLKLGISWINYGMKGCSREIMNASIKSTNQ